MAVSGLEQRLRPLEFMYHPFGPGGEPAWAELFSEDVSPESRGFAMRRILRRSRSNPGYEPWHCQGGGDQGLAAGHEEAVEEGAVACSSVPEAPGHVATAPEATTCISLKEPQVRHKAPLQAASAAETALGPQQSVPEVTTVMVSNLHTHLRRSGFVRQLEAAGFAGRFDVVHMPMVFGTSTNRGSVYVNFVSAAAARDFLGRYPPGRSGRPGAWKARPAERQGFEATVAAGKTARIRSHRNRPLVVPARGCASGA